MIVQMKKAMIFTLESHKKETLTRLRKLGVVHINPLDVESEELTVLLEKRSFFEKSLKTIPLKTGKEKDDSGKKAAAGGAGAIESADAAKIAHDALTLHERLLSTRENLDRLKQEYEGLRTWGDFRPGTVRELKEYGVDLHFCVFQQKDIEKVPAGLDYIILSRSKDESRLAMIGDPGKLPFSYQELPLPEKGLHDLRAVIKEKEDTLWELENKLTALVPGRHLIEDEITKLDTIIEFEQVRAGMQTDEQVAFLSGFVPVHSAEKLKEEAKESGWGLILQDPDQEDMVPTLVKNPKWISIVDPVFNFFGTVPGYHETDISFWFLLFFSLFFAMIIGDAGYGFCILILTLIARITMKKAPAAPFILFTVMGVFTVVWGAMTGTWFGVEQIARLPFFSRMVIDSIASFPRPDSGPRVQQFIMNLCFTLAVIHLTIAHVIHFLKEFPRLKAFADLGKILLLWGLYFLIGTVVFKKPLHGITIWLIVAGVIINFIFIEQEDHFFKGLLSSVKNIIPIVLNSISCFSDIISYVRLFAVGLATVKVAEAFNGMAAGIGFNSIAAVGSFIILLFGHSLNLVMAGMSVMVHGVRLNMLEFSGHMDLQWSGTKYKPFS